jgi:UDP-N-acetylglucosamine 2-epimerase (non-hydrolysing)
LLFTPSKDGDDNLLREGVAKEKIHLVGNVMIDTLVSLLPKARGEGPKVKGARDGNYALVTLHRPSNVDEPQILNKIITAVDEISGDLPVIFPVHPRTRTKISEFGFQISDNGRLNLIDPFGYLDFLSLQKNAKVVITDSGGIQEETTFLGIPCLTVRKNTERPITVEMGTNIVVGQDMERLKSEVYNILDGKAKQGKIPLLWDGKASERIADIIVKGMGTLNLRI